MNPLDITLLVLLVLLIIMGALLGFGRSLKFFTKGIFGIIIATVVCVFFGSYFKNLPLFSELIVKAEDGITTKFPLLDSLPVGNIIFYSIFFIIVQILQIIVVAVLANHTSDSKFIKLIGRFTGATICVAFLFALTLLTFATINVIPSNSFTSSVIELIETSKLSHFYSNNPIKF